MRLGGIILLATAATALCGCSVMDSTALSAPSGGVHRLGDQAVAQADNVDDVACRGKLGSYYLTKRLVQIKLEETKFGTDKFSYKLSSGSELNNGLVTVPDRARGYCLEFLEAPTAEDDITVERDEKQGFLKKVSSDNLDKSVKIARTVIRTIFTAITGNPEFNENLAASGVERAEGGQTETKTLLEALYDPADPAETALVNERITEKGFCVILEGQPPLTIEDYPCYCDGPMKYLERSASRGASGAARARKAVVSEHEKMASGIYYRPRRPYAYSVLINSDRVRNPSRPRIGCTNPARSGWALREEKTLELENLSPIIAIRVDRTFFATRKTSILFDDGVLYDVKIRKDSELAGFVEIPLQIAKSVVAVPGNLVKVRFDNTQSRTRLVAAQMVLLNQQKMYVDKLAVEQQKIIDAQQVAIPPVAGNK